MTLTRFLLKFTAKFIGADAYGNHYYQQKPRFVVEKKLPRRWVIYHDIPEASKIPAEWHGWLHHTHVAPVESMPHTWQKPHEMNLSGTPNAYRPTGSLYKNFKSTVTQRYQAWQPEDTKIIKTP